MESRYLAEYKSKLRTVADAAQLIESGDHIAIPPITWMCPGCLTGGCGK